MNSELFSFSILAAILGMGVVFLFLGILSLLMATINRVFGDEPGPDKPAAAPSAAEARRTGKTAPPAADRSLPDWVLAAAVVFLAEEDLDFQRSASAWKPVSRPSADGWLQLPRL